MSKLYELQEQLVQIDNILEAGTDEESGQILEQAKDLILSQVNDKMESILQYISDSKSKTEQLKEREEQLAKKRKSLENRIVYLKNMLLWYMKTNNKTKETYGDWDVSVSKTPAKVVLDVAEEEIPAYYKKVVWTIDKTLLKQMMINDSLLYKNEATGEIKQIAHNESGETIRIK